MSDYWVSTGKFWCKYCKVFVTDNKISRDTHDATGKHKYAVKLHLRQVQKTAKEQAESKKLLERIEHAAQRQFSKDIKSGIAGDMNTQEQQEIKWKQRQSFNHQKRKYENRRAELGKQQDDNVDPDNTIETRDTCTLPGEWQTVETNSSTTIQNESTSSNGTILSSSYENHSLNDSSKNQSSCAAAYVQEDDHDEYDFNSFKLKEKTVELNDDEGEDNVDSSTKEKSVVSFKKRKINRNSRKNE